MTPAATLLDRLDGVRPLSPGRDGADRWLARCPAHDDRSPSLMVSATGDDVVLLHCYAACQAPDIVAAVGLEVADLFPQRSDDHRRRPTPARDRLNWRDSVQLLSRETTVVAIAAGDVVAGRTLTDADLERVQLAKGRIERVADLARSGRR